MKAETSYKILSLSPCHPKLESKRSSVTRRELEVAELTDDLEESDGIVTINKSSNTVRMPNGEIWRYGGLLGRGRLRFVSHHQIWKEIDCEPTTYKRRCTPWVDELKDRALAKIDYPWQNLGTSIKFVSLHRRRGQRKTLGMAFWPSNRIEIYLKYWDYSIRVARTVAHEIGHIVDWACLTDEDRGRWRRARGFSQDYPWRGNEYRPDWKDPCGDFAECFAAWQVPEASVRISRPPCVATLDLVAELAEPIV